MDEYTNPSQEPQAPDTAASRPESTGYSGGNYSAANGSGPYGADYSGYVNKPKKAKARRGGAGRIIALALCFSLLGSVLGAGGVFLVQGLARGSVSSEADSSTTAFLRGLREKATIQTAQVDTSREMNPAEVYAANVHSTVGITTSVTTNFWGFQTTSAASGSGFIISADGYILTNHHVIEDSNSVTVTMYDGTTYDAEIVGYDESNDIAVLKIDAKDLPPVILGDSDNLNVGDSVIAIGNPLGELTFSLTSGCVSAKDRKVTLSGGLTMDLIQTDAAINSGNSGGALFNLHGEVVGVTNAKYSSSSSSQASIDNIGFAIPINTILPIVESIIEKGYVSKPYIGVSVGNVSQESQLYGLPKGGAIVEITEGSPAEEAGLQVGDIVTAVGGSEITSSDDLVRVVRAAKVGDELKLTVYRQGQTVELTVTVAEKIQSATAQPEAQNQSQTSGGQQQPGFSFPFGFFR